MKRFSFSFCSKSFGVFAIATLSMLFAQALATSEAFAVSVTAPCRGDADSRPTQKGWRKCIDVIGGKADNFDSRTNKVLLVAKAKFGSTKAAGNGILGNLEIEMQKHIDRLYKISPNRCDSKGSDFTDGAEAENDHFGQACGAPLHVSISHSDFSIILNLGLPYATLEESYFYGMLPQLNYCMYEKTTRGPLSITAFPPVIDIGGSCSAPAADYNSHRAHFESVFAERYEALVTCPDREITEVDVAGQGNNFGNISQACLQLQAARQLLESSFTTLLTCNMYEQADMKYRKLLGSPSDQIDIIKQNATKVQPICQSRCSPITDGFDPLTDDVDELITELEDCSNECYQEIGPPSLIEIIQQKTDSACRSELSWTTLLSVISLAFRPRRRTIKASVQRSYSTVPHLLILLILGLAMGLGGCSKDPKTPPQSSGTPPPPPAAAPEAKDVSGDLAALQAKLDALQQKFSDLDTYMKNGAGGNNVSPTPTITITTTPTSNGTPNTSPSGSAIVDGSSGTNGTVNSGTTTSNGTLTSGGTGGTLTNGGGTTGGNVSTGGLQPATFPTGVSLSSAGGASGSGSSSSKGKSSSGGSSSGSPNESGLNDANAKPGSRVAGIIEGVGGNSSGSSSGGAGGYGGGGNGGSYEGVSGGGAGDKLVFQQNPERSAIVSGDPYNESYFSLISPNKSLFEEISKRYSETSQDWARKDAGIGGGK